jgi:5-methylcytosine-specific restriction endonuclease McrA
MTTMNHVSKALQRKVATAARHRCGYCLTSQQVSGAQMHIEHIIPLERWCNHGTKIIGLTPTGRATVVALRLNNEFIVPARRQWTLAGWHPPQV